MSNYITDPLTQKNYHIKSRYGKKILIQYLTYLKGGTPPSPTSLNITKIIVNTNEKHRYKIKNKPDLTFQKIINKISEKYHHLLDLSLVPYFKLHSQHESESELSDNELTFSPVNICQIILAKYDENNTYSINPDLIMSLLPNHSLTELINVGLLKKINNNEYHLYLRAIECQDTELINIINTGEYPMTPTILEDLDNLPEHPNQQSLFYRDTDGNRVIDDGISQLHAFFAPDEVDNTVRQLSF